MIVDISIFLINNTKSCFFWRFALEPVGVVTSTAFSNVEDRAHFPEMKL